MELNKAVNYISEIKQILAQARQKAYTAVNAAMVEAYWLVGKRIVEEEQQGEGRAAYGKEILKTLADELNIEFGKGFSVTNLQNFRKFYLTFSNWSIQQTVSVESGKQNKQTGSVKSNSKKEIGQSPSDHSINRIWLTAFAKLSWSHFERLIRVENKEARNYYLIEAAQQHWGVSELELGKDFSFVARQKHIRTIEREKLIIKQKMGL